MADDSIRLDPMTQIVNVQWDEEGLAVEFGDHAADAPPPKD